MSIAAMDGFCLVAGQFHPQFWRYAIFADEKAYRSIQAYAIRPGIIGDLIPDEDYFELFAHDCTGPTWQASGIMPWPQGGLSQGLIFGHINTLTQTESVESAITNDYIRLRFKGKLKFPSNQNTETIVRIGGKDRKFSNSFNVAIIENGQYSFEILHESNHTVVSMTLPSGTSTVTTPSRVLESFQFILGKQLALMTIETYLGHHRSIKLSSLISFKGHGKIEPPLNFRVADEGGHIWRMFLNYFHYVRNDTTAALHPISQHISSVIESSVASLDTEILALSIAIEGLIGRCFPNLAPVSSEFLRELDALQNELTQIRLFRSSTQTEGVVPSEELLKRISGAMEGMRKSRNSDILRKFLLANNLPKELYNSWSRLRNTSAHGGGAGSRDIETIFRLKNEVLSLMHSIVFAAIDYQGPRVDYSKPNWPTTTWQAMKKSE